VNGGRLTDWLERYFTAWRSNDPEEVAALFAPDAVYSYGPFGEPSVGRDAIVRRWVDGGAPTTFTYRCEPLAVLEDGGVAHWSVGFAHPSQAETRVELDGILVLTFDDEGRCTQHREWYATRRVRAP
jgi:uncharacterized protein (TIGR02246 family)